jgi:hypothetical protein
VLNKRETAVCKQLTVVNFQLKNNINPTPKAQDTDFGLLQQN